MAKLLVIVSYKVFPPQMGGQKGIVHFYEHLKQHHTLIMAVSGDNEKTDSGYRVENFLYNNHRMAANILRLRRLRSIIRKKEIDAIIAEHSYTGWIAWILKKWTGKPFLIHSHNIEASRFRQMGKRGWQWYHRYEKWIHQQANFNFFKTEEEMSFARQAYALPEQKCAVIPYGVHTILPKPDAALQVRQQYNISSEYLFYFNGTLDYAPNQKAVERIIDAIHPLLLKAGIDFTILISGKNLPLHLQRKLKSTGNIVYLQYVADVNLLYQASTLFLNPVINDSGVKTKLVEALANQCTVISTHSGATGLPRSVCGQKLISTKDGDWPAFVAAMRANLTQKTSAVPPGFFTYFSWPIIAKKTAVKIQDIITHV